MSDIRYEVKSGFYDSQDKDRLYSADDMNMPYKGILTDGLTKEGGQFLVSPATGMRINVAGGLALLGGKWVESTGASFNIPANTSVTTRIDSVILQVDTNVEVRAANLILRQGTTSAPDLVNSDGISEFRIANIRVVSGATSIYDFNITDKRGTAECPYVTLSNLGVDDQIADVVTDWLNDNVDPVGSAVVVDDSLTIAGAAADAKKTGDEIADLKTQVGNIGSLIDVLNGEVI